MFTSDQYQLLDFGGGRKLERFAGHVLDRPSPAAAGATVHDPNAWQQTDARFERSGEQGTWWFARERASHWLIRHTSLTLELKLTDFGHLGVFPEQAENWDWIGEQIRRAGRPLKILNLFAYTGASTLAAAAAGAQVTHVDAAANIVAWARRNAELSDLAQAPIRWIIDDAVKFARRELKRKNFHDAIILDPSGYGHGPRGEVWTLEEDLPELLGLCLELLSRDREFLLLTCHSGELAAASGLLKYLMAQAPGLRETGTIEASDMHLVSAFGKRLHAGAALRWTARRK